MPADSIIRTGDMIRVTIFPPAIVPPLLSPIPLIGTGVTVNVIKMATCLDGDEIPPVLRVPLPYTAPPYVTPGTGTLSVTLTPMNKTATTKNGKVILIKGTPFPAELNVVVPALMPTPAGPVPDPVVKKPGMAEFITTNMTVKAG